MEKAKNFALGKISFKIGFSGFSLRNGVKIISFSSAYLVTSHFAYFEYKDTRTTDTQLRHKSKISEKLGRRGRQNMLWPFLKIWDWD